MSIAQPWVRPIVRGKAHANTEFGAKLHLSMVDGYARIERLSFDAFNEATDFFAAVEAYRTAYGCYPKRVLADKIYRNRETLAWCKERGIQLTGRRWDGLPKMHNRPGMPSFRSTGTSVTGTRLRANSVLASGAMVWAGSWLISRRHPSVWLGSPFCA